MSVNRDSSIVARSAGLEPDGEGASTEQLAEAQRQLDVTFPPDYIEFMAYANGAGGFIGEALLYLYRLERVVERNLEDWEAGFPRHYVEFGSDGGGEAYVFDKRGEGAARIIQKPADSDDPADAIPVGATLAELFEFVRQGAGLGPLE